MNQRKIYDKRYLLSTQIFNFVDFVFLRCLSDGCIFHCHYSTFKNNKYENRLGHYCLCTDERGTTYIVYNWS